MINSQKVLYSDGKNDECYTPFYVVEAILKDVNNLVRKKLFLRKKGAIMYPYEYNKRAIKEKRSTIEDDLIVWCPFDTDESYFVKLLSKMEHVKVVHSHIKDGLDFFDYEPNIWDIMISNPPFTNKRKYFERALSFKKPFALLMSITWLNDKAPKEIFGDDLQLCMFDNRALFMNPEGTINDKITFSSAFFGYRFFYKAISVKSIPTIKEQKRILSVNT